MESGGLPHEVVAVELEVNIKDGRANANEIFCAVSSAGGEFSRELALEVAEQYQERAVEVRGARRAS